MIGSKRHLPSPTLQFIYPDVEIVLTCAFGIFPVQMPASGISRDIFMYAIECLLIPDNVFPIAALPDRATGCISHLVDASGRGCLENSHDLEQRTLFASSHLVDHHNSMHMVRHNNEGAQRHVRMVFRQIVPTCRDYVTILVQSHSPIPNFPKR